MIFYQDRSIEAEKNDVILSGGYSGHANFGDVAQLKSVLSWYKERGYNPIVIIRLDAVYDEEFIEKLYEWFDVKAFIFYATVLFDASKYKLKRVENFSCQYFHLYGGGMINKFWAKDIINLCETIIEFFNIKNYVVSGQQIDHFGAMLLQTHYQKYEPSVVGVRDMLSLQYLQEVGIEAYYSFDDAYEELEELSSFFQPLKSDVQEIYLHFNLSPYVSDDLVAMVHTFKESLKLLKKHYPKAKYKLLLTYLDSRILSIVDTLGVVGSLDYHFDMCDVSIVNLAALSLKNKCDKRFEIDKNAVILATSYHTAMFMQLLGLKVFMFAGNEYYEQKREGLGLDKYTIEEFLANDFEVSFHENRKNDRKIWLSKLSENYHRHRVVVQEKAAPSIIEKKAILFKHKPIQTNLETALKQLSK